MKRAWAAALLSLAACDGGDPITVGGRVEQLARVEQGKAKLRRIVVALPGSPGAVRLAMEKLVIPEIGHLVQQASK